ncbi:Exosome complex exonuclease, partial [Actinidia chinensis var. chinensis]
MVGLSVGEKHFIQGGIAQDLRSDGRKRLTYRPISVETGIIPQANGSARVKLGATDVIASVKAELGKPSPFQPDRGKVAIYVDCSPTAAPIFEANGSARVKLGATDVIASVKAELGKPSPFQPDRGKVAIYVDCSPTAAPIFEGRGGEELSAELSAALQRSLLGGKSGTGAGIDLSSLSIVEGKICWDFYIDGLVV